MSLDSQYSSSSPSSSWIDIKWCKLFESLEEDNDYCGIDYWWSLADPRTKSWVLVESAVPVAVILSIYYSFVLLGYRMMRA